MSRLVKTRPYKTDVVRRLGVKSRRHFAIHQGVQLLLAAGLLSGAALAQTTAVSNTQLPTGGQVSAGQATLSQSGSTLNVNQTSQRAIVDWSSFNVGQNATVNFQQPNAQ